MKKSDVQTLYYSYLVVWDKAFESYEHAVNNYEVTYLKPDTLIGYGLLNELNKFREIFPVDIGLENRVIKIQDLIERHIEKGGK